MSKYKNIIFDLDGTIVDSKEAIINSLLHTLKEFDIVVSNKSDLYWCASPRLKTCFSKLLKVNDKDILQKAVSIYRDYYAKFWFVHTKIYDDILDVLIKLKANGFRLFLVSNKPISLIEETLKKIELTDIFESFYGNVSSEGKVGKERLVEEVIYDCELKIEETILIGDRKYDILAAKSNDLDTIAVLYGYASETELKGVYPDYLVKNPKDILKVIG